MAALGAHQVHLLVRLYLPGHYQLKINGSGALIDKVQHNYWAKLTSSVSRLYFLC